MSHGSTVVIHYTLSLGDGTEVDTTQGGEPLQFRIGDGSLEAGLECLLLELLPGDKRRFHLSPGAAFGDPDPASVHTLGRAEFPAGMQLREGVVVGFTTPSGEEIAGTIMDLVGESVVVDFNHPLAGRTLDFEVEIVSVDRNG
ncbi:MAG: peptidylprolyl isomerase [Gammaproteobacteria bacterium]|nr:peptidylprolyl isomerase [Gammaproteobacteria bacterium]